MQDGRYKTMVMHPHQSVAPQRITTATAFLESAAAVDGILRSGFVKTQITWPAPLTIGVLKNGIATGSTFILPANTQKVDFSGLEVAVTKSDLITLEPIGWPSLAQIGPKTFAQYEIDDGLPERYGGASVTEHTIGGGSKMFVVNDRALGYVPGSRVRFVDASNVNNWMEGVVTDYTDNELTDTIVLSNGAGTIDDWVIALTGERGQQGNIGDQGLPGESAFYTQDVSFQTGELDDQETGVGSVAMAIDFKLKRVIVDGAGRLRLYKTATARDSDLARSFGDRSYRGTQHKMLCDIYLDDDTTFEWYFTPDVQGSNGDDPETNNIYWSFTNVSGVTRETEIELRFIEMQGE
jgi:hypothetical protein